MFEEFPYHQSILHTAAADYVELPGWAEDISGARSESDLPPEARDYLAAIAEHAGSRSAWSASAPAVTR